jgi:hypothetical protein
MLAVVSEASVNDEALCSEWEYAMPDHWKPLLAVVLDSVPLPAEIARGPVVDYTRPDEEAVVSAIFALRNRHPGTIMDDPPHPPPVPLTRIDVLNSRIASPQLEQAEQEDIVSQLEEAAGLAWDPDAQQAIWEMVGKLAARRDLVLTVARRIDQLQMEIRESWPVAGPVSTTPPGEWISPSPSAPASSSWNYAPPAREAPASQADGNDRGDHPGVWWDVRPATTPGDRAVQQAQKPARKQKKPGDQPDDAVSRAVKAAVKPGLLMFNPPAEMTQGKKERIEVGIARSPQLREALAAGLRGHGTPQFEAVPTSSMMGVELKGTSFEITPFSPVEQLVTPKARWEFDVRANRAGQQTLTLCISMRVNSPAATKGRIAIPVLERDIKIHVDIGFGTRRFLASNWQWLVTAVAGLGGALVAWITLFHSLSQFSAGTASQAYADSSGHDQQAGMGAGDSRIPPPGHRRRHRTPPATPAPQDRAAALRRASPSQRRRTPAPGPDSAAKEQ